MAQDHMHSWLKELPKCELHLHLEGTITPELTMQFAQEYHRELPYNSKEELQQSFNFTNLQSFLDVYTQCADTIRTPEQLYRLGCHYIAQAAQQGVIHTEITTEPQAHEHRGITFAQFMEAAIAIKKTGASMGISVGIILGLLRDLPPEQATYCIEKSKPFRDHIVGVGLASTEVGYPPSLFAPAFKLAKELGYHRTCHAGEEAGPEYIWQALQIGAQRIDHGIHCIKDQKLMDHLAKEQIPVPVCPLSNVALNIVPSLEQHPLPQMIRAELNVSIHADDPAFFNGYIADNYIAIAKTGILTRKELVQCAINSARGSFISAEKQQKIIDTIVRFSEQH